MMKSIKLMMLIVAAFGIASCGGGGGGSSEERAVDTNTALVWDDPTTVWDEANWQ